MAQTHHTNQHLGTDDSRSSLSLLNSHSPGGSSMDGTSLHPSPGPGASGSSNGATDPVYSSTNKSSNAPPFNRQQSSDSSYGHEDSTESGADLSRRPERQSSGGLDGFAGLAVTSPAGAPGQGQGQSQSQSQSQAYANLGLGQAREETVPVGFDEGILRGLCDMDVREVVEEERRERQKYGQEQTQGCRADSQCALPLLADRIKQSIASCKQVAVFFRSRADIEEKYARSLVELGRNTSDVYARADCKSGTFVTAYQGSLRLQEQLAHNRLRFSQRLNEMSDELLSLGREGEKMRKQHKENGSRYQAILQESEAAMDKAKARFDSTAEELERVLVAKEGESMKESGMRSSASTSGNLSSAGSSIGGSSLSGNGVLGSGSSSSGGSGANGRKAFGKAIKSGGMLFKGKGPASMAKHEDDTRARMAQASETFRKAVLESQTLRQEYFNFQLPKILRLLKECADELDMGTQYHLTRFAFLYETTIVGDGQALNPMGSDDSLGLKHLFESIDNRNDFKSYMQNYAVARGAPRGPRRDGPYEDGFLPPMPQHVPPGQKPLNISAPFPTSDPLPANLGPASGGGGGMNGAYPSAQSNAPISQGHDISGDTSRSQSFSNQPAAPGTGTGTDGSASASASGLGAGAASGSQGWPSGGSRYDPSASMRNQQSQYMPPADAANAVHTVTPATGSATYGVDLGEQLARDGGEVPRVVEKCVQAVEAYGLENTGIYRLSGTTSKVQALKRALDNDINNTDVMSDDWSADINVVSGALKLWFRELPEPLLTYGLYHLFIDAARHENDRLRHIKLHEQVNELPDPNYATLKYFMGHLDRIRRKESVNQMSISNLSIVFGPTLLGAPPEEGGLNLEHMSFQCKAIETILEKYSEIFVEEEDGA